MLFKHSEFNGLLQAKHPDAVRNCSSFKHKKSFDLFQESRNMNKAYIQGSGAKTLGEVNKNISIINQLASNNTFSNRKSVFSQRRLSKSVKDVFPIPRSAIGVNSSGVKSLQKDYLDQDLNLDENKNQRLQVTVSLGHNSAIGKKLALFI